MPFDAGNQIVEWLEQLASAIAGLGFFVPIALIVLFNLFGKKDKDKSRNQPSTPPQRQSPPATQRQASQPTPTPAPMFPLGPPSWMEMQAEKEPSPPSRRAPRQRGTTQWGSTFDKPDVEDDKRLRWGSAFDDNDAAFEDRSLKWGSAFDNPREQTRWGFDDTDWGSGFTPKTKDTEPKITVS